MPRRGAKVSEKNNISRMNNINVSLDDYFFDMVVIYARKNEMSLATAVRTLVWDAITGSPELEPEQARVDAIQWSKR